MEARYAAYYSARRGSDLHALAHEAIRLGIHLSESHEALSKYVDDGLGFKMQCEQSLRYSENCFGTADTIAFRAGTLRIHDLKTGIVATSFRQLEVYAAIFCLEYGVNPFEIQFELRIYQRDDVKVHIPNSDMIAELMDTIVRFDEHIEQLKESERY